MGRLDGGMTLVVFWRPRRAQTPARQIINVEITPLFIQMAADMGIKEFFTGITNPRVRNWLRWD